jgi:5-methylcytosine-specific restriction endonuclease McrA
MISLRARQRLMTCQGSKYPTCWKRASATIRRLAGGVCQRCGQPAHDLSVHHIGTPFADGRPGDKTDKHDIRRENLIALCFTCHDELDHIRIVRAKQRERKARRQARRAAHQALGIGTGLILYQPSI